MTTVLSNRSAAASVFAFACTLAACSQDPLSIATTTPQATIPFPDSITRANGLPPRASDGATVALGDTVFYGRIAATPIYRDGDASRRVASLTIRDTSVSVLRYKTAALAVCPLSVEISRAESPEKPAWQSERAAGANACPPVQASDPRDIAITWNVTAILGDSLPAGKYQVRMKAKLADARVLGFATTTPMYLDASGLGVSTDYSTLKFETSVVVVGQAPRTVRATALVINTGARPVAVSYGACAVTLRLYWSAARTGTPIWRSEFRKPPYPNTVYGCPLGILSGIVLPGDSLPFRLDVPAYEVLADSLPPGHYFAATEFALLTPQFLTQTTSGVAIALKLPAGEIDLSNAPDPLPSSRIIDGLSYTATTRLINGRDGLDTIRTLVLVNTTSKRVTTTLASGCPVIAYGYRTAALRDSVPIVNSQISTATSSCSLDYYPIALEPGQSWVFGTDVAVATFRTSFGPGRYWFTAWPTLASGALLAAGDVLIQ